MTLKDATVGNKYIIENINTSDEDLCSFLFSLGCYSGEELTLISKLRHNCVVAIKNTRYSMDNKLAEAILLS